MTLTNWRLAFGKLRRWIAVALATQKAMPRRVKLAAALAIFSLSFVTRSLQAVDLATQMYTADQPFAGLTAGYDERATSILDREGLIAPSEIKPWKTIALSKAPGYSIYLSAIYRIFGRNFFKVQLVQNALNSLAPVLIFLIAGQVISWRVGVVSGLLAAVSHHLSHISNFIIPDSVCALPILAAIYCLVLAARRQHAYLLFGLAGLLTGISTWLRPQSMLLGVFVAGILWITRVREPAALKRAALLAACSILTIAPITITNYVVYHAFVPVSVGLGVNLWEGIADASGDRFGAVATDDQVAAQEAILYNNPRYAGSMHSPDGIERDHDRVRRSMAIIRVHPFWYAAVMLGRMREMLTYKSGAPLVYGVGRARLLERTAPVRLEWVSIDADTSALAIGRSMFWMRPLIKPLQRITKEAMQLMIGLGALFMFISSRRRALFISLVPLYYLLFQSFVHTEFRFSLPMQYFVFVFAAIAWVLIGVSITTGIGRVLSKSSEGSHA